MPDHRSFLLTIACKIINPGRVCRLFFYPLEQLRSTSQNIPKTKNHIVMQNRRTNDLLNVSQEEVISLFKSQKDPERAITKLLYLVGSIFTPITAIGALWGFVRAYNRDLKQHDEYPMLANLKPLSRIGMILGSVFIWIVIIVAFYLTTELFSFLVSDKFGRSPMPYVVIGLNLLLTAIALYVFRKWQSNIFTRLQEKHRFGSARWAWASELADLVGKSGLYIGNKVFAYAKQCHALVVAGTRSGKFVNLIAPFLLGLSKYRGSLFIVDLKKELTAVTSRFQKQQGQTVYVLDPTSSDSACYNPLDLVINQTNPDHLIDDVSIIAEMIVPKEVNGEQYWNNRARTMIAGLILHLVTARPSEEQHLGTLWGWLRLPEEQWHDLMADMAISDNEIVQATANEFIALMKASDKAFASIMSTACDKTDFLKSPGLRKLLQSSTFDINTLSNGKTTLYVVIPPDKLDTYGLWLRLVFTTALRAVVRNRNRRVTFLVDECATLGYLPELKTALSTYAGYNISLYLFFQDLSQIRSIYGEAWETFVSNTAIRQFFGVNDNFTAEYLEKAMGVQTVVSYEAGPRGSTPKGTARALATADEIKRGSKDNIFTFIEQRPPTYFPKVPYYAMPELMGLHDKNPYYTPEADQEK